VSLFLLKLIKEGIKKNRDVVKGKSKKLTKTNIIEKYDLSETDKKVIQYKLQFPDITHNEIAILINSSREYVTQCFQKPPVKKALAELEDNFGANWKERIIKAKEKASKKLVKLIDSPNPAISIRAIENILQLDKQIISEGGDEDNKLEFKGFDNNS